MLAFHILSRAGPSRSQFAARFPWRFLLPTLMVISIKYRISNAIGNGYVIDADIVNIHFVGIDVSFLTT